MQASPAQTTNPLATPIARRPKSRRCWLQFSLRSLIVFTLLGGIASGRLGRLIEEKYDNERAIAEERKAWDESHTVAAAIRQKLGVTAIVCTVLKPPDFVYVEINGGSATDETLKQLAAMPRIGSLQHFGGHVTDSGVQHLSKLNGLQYLLLRAKNVTDASLPFLTGMSKLRRLDLKSTKVTDASVSELQKSLPNCEIIR